MEWRLEPFVLLKTRLFLSVNRVRGPFSGKGLISIFGIPRRENQPFCLKKQRL